MFLLLTVRVVCSYLNTIDNSPVVTNVLNVLLDSDPKSVMAALDFQ